MAMTMPAGDLGIEIKRGQQRRFRTLPDPDCLVRGASEMSETVRHALLTGVNRHIVQAHIDRDRTAIQARALGVDPGQAERCVMVLAAHSLSTVRDCRRTVYEHMARGEDLDAVMVRILGQMKAID